MSPLLLAALKTAMAGGTTGAIYGGIGRLLKEGATLPEILKSAGTGAAGMGSLVGASTLLGGTLMGNPKDDESNPWLRRGALGGAALGVLGGGALGGLAAAGKLPRVAPEISSFLTENLPLKNLVTEKIMGLSKDPSAIKTALGAAAGGAGLGALAGYSAADEGQMYDSLQREIQAARKKRMMEQL